jgi:hypothetical protein
MLREVLIKVLLQDLIADSVPILMLSIVVAMLLQAVIGQVHVVVAIVQLVVVRGGAQVALVVEEDFLLSVQEDPHADVEFSTFKKEGALDVLLNDPASVLRASGDELNYIVELIEYLYPPALVGGSRLNKPDIVRAMLHRYPLFGAKTLR